MARPHHLPHQFRSDGLLTARVMTERDFSLELQRSGPCSLSLPYRRSHVVSFYVGPAVRVERQGSLEPGDAEFSGGTTGIYPAGEGERIEWQGPTVALHLHLSPKTLETRWRDQGGIGAFRLRRVFSTGDRALRTLGAALYDCARTVGTAHRTEMATLIAAVSDRLVEEYADGWKPVTTAPAIGRATLDALLDGMHGPAAAETRVPALAARAQLSERRFRQAFRQCFGTSPHDYLLRCRLELAKHLIQRNETALTMVALDSGFYDQAHFSRTFRARIGFSPSEYADWLRAHDVLSVA